MVERKWEGGEGEVEEEEKDEEEEGKGRRKRRRGRRSRNLKDTSEPALCPNYIVPSSLLTGNSRRQQQGRG